ncbi:hypothetical protein AO057_06380 [Curvibacter sp. PAE-UM]|nr:hypothetical protein AO057_06380 [Curvibacter sp. PAE-UM]
MVGLALRVHADPEAGRAPQIQSFRITSKAGKQSMTVIRDKARAAELGLEGYGKPCVNNVASPRWTASMGSEILAVFDCPAANDGGADSIIARFEKGDAEAPTCFGRISLMRDSSSYYYGQIRSIQARSLPDRSFMLAISMSGGDAGANWESHAFVHIDQSCRPTLLAQYRAGMAHHETEDDVCSGTHLKYQFISDSVVSLNRFRVTRCKGLDPVLDGRESTQQLDLQELLRNPKLRIAKP